MIFCCCLFVVSFGVQWNTVVNEERIWKAMFIKDFMWWNTGKELFLKEGQTWKSLYIEYHLKGWQWDPSATNQKIVLSDNNFSASLTSGYTYHGARTTRGEERGIHYLEVLIVPCEDDKRLDNTKSIFMGIGVANAKFNVENCCSGWTGENGGIGYYNDGQVYGFSDRLRSKSGTLTYKSGDSVGVEFNLEEGEVSFYLNGSLVAGPFSGIKGKVYPHLILANDVKHKVTITKGKKSATQNPTPRVAQAYEEALSILSSMGFVNQEFCRDLLLLHDGDIAKVINELLA